MSKRLIRIVSVILLMTILFISSAYATHASESRTRATPVPRMSIIGSTATCTVKLIAPGQFIDATLELKQGSTIVASWSDSGTGIVNISGSASVTTGVTYTLTVYGTVDGVAFTPASTTITP